MGGKKIISFYLFMENLHPQKGKKKKVCCNRLEDYRVWAERGCKPLFLKKKTKKNQTCCYTYLLCARVLHRPAPIFLFWGVPPALLAPPLQPLPMGAPVQACSWVPLLCPLTKTAWLGPPPTPVSLDLTESSGSKWLLLLSIWLMRRKTAVGAAGLVHITGSVQVRKTGGGVWGELQYRWFFI